MEKTINATLVCKDDIYEKDGKCISYVETYIVNENGVRFRVNFKDRTKTRFNAYLKSLGFEIGEIKENERKEKIE